MEAAAGKLENLFSQAEHELNLLSSKVDAQYAAIDENSKDSDIKAEPIHATQVVKSVRQLRSQLVKVSEDVASLQQQQEQIMVSVQSELSSLAEHLTNLSSVVEGDSHNAV